MELLFVLVFAPFALDVGSDDPESGCWPSGSSGPLFWTVESLLPVCVGAAAAVDGVVEVKGSAALGFGVEKAPKPLELALMISSGLKYQLQCAACSEVQLSYAFLGVRSA